MDDIKYCKKMMVGHRTLLYEYLHKCTDLFEKGLGGWHIPAIPARKTKRSIVEIEKRIEYMSIEINKNKEYISNMYYVFAYRDDEKLFKLREIEKHEQNLRVDLLASFLKIPEQKLLDDSLSRDCIEHSSMNVYIIRRLEIIDYLRQAKRALNLAQDRYSLLEPAASMRRDDLDEHLKDCADSLDKARQALQQKIAS